MHKIWQIIKICFFFCFLLFKFTLFICLHFRYNSLQFTQIIFICFSLLRSSALFNIYTSVCRASFSVSEGSARKPELSPKAVAMRFVSMLSVHMYVCGHESRIKKLMKSTVCLSMIKVVSEWRHKRRENTM